MAWSCQWICGPSWHQVVVKTTCPATSRFSRSYFILGRSEVGQTLDAMAAYRSRSGWWASPLMAHCPHKLLQMERSSTFGTGVKKSPTLTCTSWKKCRKTLRPSKLPRLKNHRLLRGAPWLKSHQRPKHLLRYVARILQVLTSQAPCWLSKKVTSRMRGMTMPS